MNFTEQFFIDSGFDGFVPVVDFSNHLHSVPTDCGVYVVLHRETNPPHFLTTNPGGQFKKKDPTVSIDTLKAKWLPSTPTLYIGKATSLQSRLRALVKFANGQPVGHWGGRYLWQVAGSEKFVIVILPVI